MRSQLIVFAGLISALCACKTVSTRPEQQPKEIVGDVIATAIIEPKSGSKAHGQAWFAKTNDGIQVFAIISNLSPGPHGIHIHEKGDCSAPDASSAGGHYNPAHLEHGTPDPRSYHVGDLGNIKANAQGVGVLNLTIPKAHFNPNFKDYSEIHGKSLVVHGGPDDLHSQPAGNSGNRIGCGVIRK